jgi:hypothetical protein
MIFQTNSKPTTDGEPQINKDFSQPSNINSGGLITNAMITTLAETPCKYEFNNSVNESSELVSSLNADQHDDLGHCSLYICPHLKLIPYPKS